MELQCSWPFSQQPTFDRVLSQMEGLYWNKYLWRRLWHRAVDGISL